MEMDQHLFDECTTAYRAERMKEKQVKTWSVPLTLLSNSGYP